MTEREVRDRLASVAWEAFVRWMHGQTMGFNDDGSTTYYEHDVERFCAGLAGRGRRVPVDD